MARPGGGGAGGGAGSGARRARVRLRPGKGRKPSSRRWLERQLNDPYVAAARAANWRSRSAFKLIELDDRFHLLAPGRRVVDLGAAPGGWSQVAAERVAAGEVKGGVVVALDLQPIEPLPGVVAIEGDSRDAGTLERVRAALGGAADVVLSDMAAPATGHAATDHVRVIALCEVALAFATNALSPGGFFVCKVFQGGAEAALLTEIKRRFAVVRHAKPKASRAASAETYLVASGFRGSTGVD